MRSRSRCSGSTKSCCGQRCSFSGPRVVSVLISNFTDCHLLGKFAADACCEMGITIIVRYCRFKYLRLIQHGTRPCIYALRNSEPSISRHLIIYSLFLRSQGWGGEPTKGALRRRVSVNLSYRLQTETNHVFSFRCYHHCQLRFKSRLTHSHMHTHTHAHAAFGSLRPASSCVLSRWCSRMRYSPV